MLGGVALCAALVGCSQDRATSTQSLNDGLGELNSGQVSGAIEKLERAAASDPTYADPDYYLGQIYHQKYGQFDDAARHYANAIKRAPDNPQFHYRYGTVLAEQAKKAKDPAAQRSKHADAVAAFNDAIKGHETFPKAWFRKGLSELAMQQYTEGVSSLSKSIQLDATMRIGDEDPGGAAYHALGDLYNRYGFHDKALQVYDNGITNNPGSAQLYRGRGVAELKLKRFAEAEQSFRAALEKEPRNAKAFFNLAMSQHAQSKYKDALDSLQRFIITADPIDDGVRIMAAGSLRSQIEADMEREAQ
jgi:tetratricopeptide (TPR) repeat protein